MLRVIFMQYSWTFMFYLPSFETCDQVKFKVRATLIVINLILEKKIKKSCKLQLIFSFLLFHNQYFIISK